MKIGKKTLEKIRNYFKTKPEVVAVYLYGSFAKRQAREESDIDLGVIVEEVKENQPFEIPQVVFAQELSQILDREVEVQNLSSSDLEFVHRVLSEGKMIFCQDDKKRISFETGIINKYFDLKPMLEEYYKILLEIAKRGELNVRYS